jgi:hypothetical protein
MPKKYVPGPSALAPINGGRSVGEFHHQGNASDTSNIQNTHRQIFSK